MVCQRLPLELIDAIFEHLTDKSALASCCLVCKAWIHRSRRHLFAAVDLNRRNANGLLKPPISSTTTSPISPYIRRLRLVGNFPASLWNETLPRLRLLENLRSLTITSTSLQPPSHFVPPVSPAVVFSNCNTVVRLHLGGVQFYTFARLAHVVCTFRHLNTLIITSSKWLRPDPPSPNISPPQSLRALELRDCDWITILQWLLSLDHVPTLHTLYVRGSRRFQGDASTLSRFLQALGPHLEQLWLDHESNEGVCVRDLFSNQSGLIPVQKATLSLI
jgi:hypothetical protein